MNKQELQIAGFEAYQRIQVAQQQIKEEQDKIIQINQQLSKLENE